VAPEVLNKTGYGKDIDWWSVGVIFFEMLVGYAPFCSEDTKDVCYKVVNWKEYLRIPDDKKVSNEAEDLINKMINSSDERLGKNGIEEIKRHPFFEGIDWDNIRSTKAPFIPELENDYDTKYFEKFEIELPFHPPQEKYKKRKDVEFLGYTYKDGNDLYEINNDKINETINDIIKNYNINNTDDNKNNAVLVHSEKNNLNVNNKNNNNKKKIIINKKTNNNNNLNKSMIINKQNKAKIITTKTKGKSPPLISKLNQTKLNYLNPAQKQLKTIKIGDKKSSKLDISISKSTNSSQKKFKKINLCNNKNNKINCIGLSPLNNKKGESPYNNKKIANKFNGNKKISFKRETNDKNVKNYNDNSLLNRSNDVESINITKKKLKFQKY
jgi:hypothetical protein